MSEIIVRHAELKDVQRICELLKIYSEQHIVLARDEADVTFYLKNFTVCEIDGVVQGCAALRDFGNELYEVRSLVVAPDMKGRGIGRKMIEYQLKVFADTVKTVRIFALTYQVEFFRRMGFNVVEKELFPEKIWSDCVKCAKREKCDEIAVLYEIQPK
jgi:amino-acid N-acetyltransferase